MWRVEFACFLAAGTGEFSDEVLVYVAEDVMSGLVVEVDAVDAFNQLRQCFGTCRNGIAQTGIREVDIVEHVFEIFRCVRVQQCVGLELGEHVRIVLGADGLIVNFIDDCCPRVFGVDGVSLFRSELFPPIFDAVLRYLACICIVDVLRIRADFRIGEVERGGGSQIPFLTF